MVNIKFNLILMYFYKINLNNPLNMLLTQLGQHLLDVLA